jgi:cysteinyl-tRNA synthetase
MHNGFLTLDNTKMSKSLGNIFTIREALKIVRHPEVIRYFVLSSHYRGPVNYSADQLEQADAGLGRLYTALRDLQPASSAVVNGHAVQTERSEHTARFRDAMDDDFNTPDALAALQMLAREINSERAGGRAEHAAELGAELRSLGGVLGILALPTEQWFRLSRAGGGWVSDDQVDRLVEARTAARAAKNWAESDRIRHELAAAGIILEDRPGGTTVWRRM